MTAPTPPLPTFTNGQVPTAANLGQLAQNVSNLYTFSQGGFRRRRPMCVVRIDNENQEIPTNTTSDISWDSAEIDTDRMWSGQLEYLIGPRVPGLWRVGVQAALGPVTAPAAAVVAIRLIVQPATEGALDPALFAVAAGYAPIPSGVGASVSCSTVVRIPTEQDVFALIVQNSGVTIPLDAGFGGSRMWAYWIGP